jgi:hypothetical protein
MKFTGRSASRDGRRTSDQAQKTLIASYHGHHFSAERDGEHLHIYSHSGDDGVAGVRVIGSAHDRMHASVRLQNTNAANKAFWEKRKGLQ